jgi:hypothetical protein
MFRKPNLPPDFASEPSGGAGFSQFAPGTHLRYVILHHTGVIPEHFDLLLEPPSAASGQLLPTWRIEMPPGTWSEATPAARQADHRPIYMDYEGEISGNRGRVKRVAAGTAEIRECTPDSCRLELQGDLRCLVRLPR